MHDFAPEAGERIRMNAATTQSAPRTARRTSAPRHPAPVPDLDSEPWPEIDRLAAETVVDVPADLGWYSATKTALDYLVALALLPLALVLIALAAVAVKLSSRGPIFYTQTRLGLDGHKYRIIKIRTMRADCEVTSGIQWSQKGDPRVTRVGRFLRATHIDELPQLFNVLMGQMSLVGPRPERPEVIRAKGLDRLVPGYRHRLRVKPGVTGLAQVQLPADTDLTSVRYKVVYDLYYVEHQCLLLDLRLLAATVLRTCGAGPHALRRLFLLPDRDAVATEFHAHVVQPPRDEPLPQLQPA
jgi:lipopolysaccharide/colanic/teichoic acid biosynthesis glycosyltransferase